MATDIPENSYPVSGAQCMRDPPKDLIAKQAFDRLAAGYDRAGDHKPSNAYLERPATRSLLPAIDGTKLLDAGVAPGS